MARKNKYQYLKVIQGNYGYGWDDLVSYDTADAEEMKLCRQNFKEYQENESAPHRIIRRRVLNED